jgi:CheY-like chemotaxis protein
MALRVLLADESSTIKKVMQLALQDFSVEVKLVPIGLDVMQVARSFNPDIIFADVLLAKKNGYEVTTELKSDPTLKKIPVVLMWSGFMEIDEPKARNCRAERRLEKPFDADTLRQLVKDLVPATGNNIISDFLSFPEMPDMVDDRPNPAPPQPAIPAARTMPNAIPQVSYDPDAEEFENDEIQLVDFDKTRVSGSKDRASSPMAEDIDFPDIEEIEEPEEFQSIPLPKNQGLPPPPKPKPPKDDWARQDLSRYKIDLPKDDPYPINDADLTNSSIALSSGAEEITLDRLDDIDELTSTGTRRPKLTQTRPANRSSARLWLGFPTRWGSR